MSVFALDKYFSKTNLSIYKSIKKNIFRIFFILFFGLFIDSIYLSKIIPFNQIIANFTLLGGFIYKFRKSSWKIREFMIYAVIVGFIGEHLFSLALGMYNYRLGNIPLYVPLGHAIVYLSAVFFCKEKAVKLNRRKIETLFTIIISIYATLFLIFTFDVFGFVMTAITLLILRKHPRERLYYLTMYIIVAFLEIIGTSYGNWSWPVIGFNKIDFLPSYNPPSGISLFYFLLDLSVLFLYKLRHLVAWKRMKNIRYLREGAKT